MKESTRKMIQGVIIALDDATAIDRSVELKIHGERGAIRELFKLLVEQQKICVEGQNEK